MSVFKQNTEKNHRFELIFGNIRTDRSDAFYGHLLKINKALCISSC